MKQIIEKMRELAKLEAQVREVKKQIKTLLKEEENK